MLQLSEPSETNRDNFNRNSTESQRDIPKHLCQHGFRVVGDSTRIQLRRDCVQCVANWHWNEACGVASCKNTACEKEMRWPYFKKHTDTCPVLGLGESR